jgi:hypothetical protein
MLAAARLGAINMNRLWVSSQTKLAAVLLIIVLSACSGDTPTNETLQTAFAEGRSGVWVQATGEVVRQLGSTGAEQRFQVRISDELTIILLRDTRTASPVQAESGDRVTFHGRYDFHGGGGSVSQTHSDPSQPGGGGWIEVNGVREG